jgi:thymidylate kinase
MKKHFKTANETKEALTQWLSQVGNISSQNTNYYYFSNPDNSVRWIWPATTNSPVFLRFFSATSLKSKLFVLACKLAFALRLQGLVFKKHTLGTLQFPSRMNLNQTSNWALFTGTEGPNRKLVLTATNKDKKTVFVKIALAPKSAKLLQNEKKILNHLSGLKTDLMVTPKVLNQTEKWIELSDVSSTKRSLKFTDNHRSALLQLQTATLQNEALQLSQYWNQTIDLQTKISSINHPKIPMAMLRKLKLVLDSVNPSAKVQTALAHADFTPWNCFVSDEKIGLYDWEMARYLPKGFDAFHFIIQKGILIERKPWKEIWKEIELEVAPTFFNNNLEITKEYAKYYLVINSFYYLYVYSNQSHWHTQIQWLITTWNEALSDMLAAQHSHRELILMDVFDQLQLIPYAALKFRADLPEHLSQNSDVDICISKLNASNIYNYLQKHPLVKKIKVSPQSFMKSITIVLHNNELLSLDLIWELKRKNLVMMNTADVISNAVNTPFGVKKAALLDEAKFATYFYTLNNAKVPSVYAGLLSATDQEIFSSKNPKQSLQNKLKAHATNRAFNGLKNKLNYLTDTVRNTFNRRGFIVTFSGVDGAGKSTLIEITKQKIEKQLRMPVVVLRHRPSILPIISAYTMGKEAAEQKAANTLPRQGKNNSTLSSLLRFAYYYTDYILGQFYIQIKYVLRGKVVVYDRYYFDFINDSKRSNISLPNWFTKAGYFFILKPAINFFLYADPEVILARKQELDALAITTLTQKYRSLFETLGNNNSKQLYQCINNIHLNETSSSIMHSIKTNAA